MGTAVRDRPSLGAGFTFIELIVALAIIAFAFAYAIVQLDGATAPARLASGAREVAAAVEFLRGHAIQSGRPMELHIDIDTHSWTYVVPPRPSESEISRQEQEEVLVMDPVTLPKWVEFEGIQLDSSDTRNSGSLVVTFSPLGEVSPNGFMIRLVSLEIQDQQSNRFSVEVNGLTGEVRVSPGVARFEQVVKGDAF